MWTLQLLNSLSLAALLFLLSIGFSIIFGLMRIPNMAHGTALIIGGYVGVELSRRGLPFVLSAVVAGLVVALVGGLVERLLLRRLAGNDLAQVLTTLGLALVGANVCLLLWGGNPLRLLAPEAFRGSYFWGSLAFPKYRIIVMAIAALSALMLWFLVERTRIGAMIRASVDDPDIARVVGIPVSRLFTGVFCLGSFLVGIAGVLAAPILSVYPGLDSTMLLLVLIVAVVGGAGSIAGAAIGSFIVGILYTFGPVFFADFAYAVLFLPMAVILVARPQGLFGKSR
jgi:branched-chain amino acid transport system permease protein